MITCSESQLKTYLKMAIFSSEKNAIFEKNALTTVKSKSGHFSSRPKCGQACRFEFHMQMKT